MDFLKTLELLNRKERDYLIKSTLDYVPRRLDKNFAKELERKIHTRLPQGELFISMDYHLDWIAASIFMFKENYSLHAGKKGNLIDSNGNKMYTIPNNGIGGLGPYDAIHSGTQTDSDLLVAFKQKNGKYVLIIIEAKCDSDWDYGQLEEKLKRLNHLKDYIDTNSLPVELHFIMYSHSKVGDLSVKLSTSTYTSVIQSGKIQPHWIQLALPPILYDITRNESQKKSGIYDIVRVVRKTKSNPANRVKSTQCRRRRTNGQRRFSQPLSNKLSRSYRRPSH